MKRKFKQWRARVFWRLLVGRPKHRGKLSEADIQRAFAVSEDDLFFQAVLQVVADHLADNVDVLANPEFLDRPGTLAGEAGAVNALLSLHRDLEARRRAACGIHDFGVDGKGDDDDE